MKPFSATFSGHELDLNRPDLVQLSWTDLAVQLARCCRFNGAIWLDSLHHAVLAVRLCEELGLRPWAAAMLVARTLPDAFLGPEGATYMVQRQRLLREGWAAVLRKRLGLPEHEHPVLEVLLDALERRLLVIELTTGSHAMVPVAAARHGGPATRVEMRAWEDSIAVRQADRARHIATPGLPLMPVGAIPAISRNVLQQAVEFGASLDGWDAVDVDQVARDWWALIERFPGLLKAADGNPLVLPPELRFEPANEATTAKAGREAE